MRKRTYDISLCSRDLCIYGGSRGQKEIVSGGTGFLAILGILLLALVFIILARILNSRLQLQ